MSTTIDFTVQLTTISCGKCAGIYAINEKYRVQKYEESGYWHCPYCETSWGYSGGENSKLKEQVARLQSSLEHKEADIVSLRDQRAALERSRVALRGVHTRTCNRVKHGVCPCCNRQFQDLMRHMATKHPTFNAAEPAKS